MANPVMTSYVQNGKKEDVSDEISLISPTKTPFLTMIGSEPVHNTLYQWLEDVLDPPGLNAQVEGADAPIANQVPTSTRSNYTQIFAKTVSTAGTTDKVELYGKPGIEFARQMAKKSAEIKRDLEFSLVGNRQVAVAGSNTVARQFAGAQKQIDPSMVFDAQAAVAGATTSQSLSEHAILAAQGLAYATGGEPDTLFIKPADSLIIAAFAGQNGRHTEVASGDKKVTFVVNIYETPYGEIKLVMDRWMNAGDALLVDPSMWKLRPLRPWFTKSLAETGDRRQTEIIGEYGLSHKSYFSCALITNLS